MHKSLLLLQRVNQRALHSFRKFIFVRKKWNYFEIVNQNYSKWDSEALNQFFQTLGPKSVFSDIRPWISFFSFCAFRFKLNSTQSLISRAYGICSSYSNFHSELNFLKQLFYSNGFPIKLVEYYINKFLWSKYSVNSANVSETSQTMYVKLPFLGHHSDRFAKELSPIFTKFFPSVSFRIILVNNFKIVSFFFLHR